MLPDPEPGDNRDFIKLHAVQCGLGDFEFGLTEDISEMANKQTDHYNETDHTGYWHYTIERSRSRIVNPAKGQW